MTIRCGEEFLAMRIGRAHHEVRGHGSSTGPKGAANVDHSVGDSALANGEWRFRGASDSPNPPHPFHLTTSGSFPGPTLATVGGVIVGAIGDRCLSRPNAVPTLAGSWPLCVTNCVVPGLDVKLREDG